MLPAFRIRNLRRSASSPPCARRDSTDTVDTHDPIVRIAAPDYDTTVARHPEATLKYFDEVDCDIITVGTSLELAQRLEDPLPSQPGTLQTHHTFDIGQGIIPMRIWQAYEQVEPVDERKMTLSEGSNRYTDLSKSWEHAIEEARWRPMTANCKIECYRNAEIHEGDKYRQRYIQACNPPGLDKVADRPKPTDQIRASKLTLADLLNDDIHTSNPTTLSSLTNEGKRQAQAAGDRLRAIASPSRYSRKVPGSEANSAQNRWASYSRSTSPFLVKQLATPKPHTQSHRDSARQPQSAGDKLRGRASRIRHCKSAQALSDHGIGKSRSQRAVRFEDGNSAPDEAQAISSTRPEFSIESPRSHLQIFESELALAKDSSEQPALDNMRRVQPRPTLLDSDCLVRNLTLDHPARQISRPPEKPSDQAEYHSLVVEKSSKEPEVCRSIHSNVDRIGKVMLGLQTQDQSCQQANQALRLGLSAALQGFDTCVRNISDTVQSALAGRACNTEELLKLLDNLRSSTSEPLTPANIDVGSPEGIDPRRMRHTCCISKRADGRSQGLADNKASLNPNPNPNPNPQQPPKLAPLEAPACAIAEPINLPILPKASRLELERLDAGLDHKPASNDLQGSPMNGRKLEKSDRASTLPSSPFFENTRTIKTEDLPQCPRLDELDCGDLVKVARFPPLPTMEALVPSREEGSPNSKTRSGVDHQAGVSCRPSVSAAGANLLLQKSQAVPPTKNYAAELSKISVVPTSSVREAESSGQFFNRMTGRGKEATSLYPSCKPTGRGEPQHTDGVRRNATTGGLSADFDSSSRRPYSTNFSGSGRTPWDPFPQPDVAPHHSQRSGAHGPGIQSQSASPGEISDQRRDLAVGMDYAVDHHDAATVRKVQECAEQLKTLGFCSSDTDGSQRLVVYAQAADGDLLSAIDMIDEEQQAYRQRG